MQKKLTIMIEANGRYCNNLCQFMSFDSKSCQLFGKLDWDFRKKQNGNHRQQECRKAEQK